jgi:hypothetical protein
MVYLLLVYGDMKVSSLVFVVSWYQMANRKTADLHLQNNPTPKKLIRQSGGGQRDRTAGLDNKNQIYYNT